LNALVLLCLYPCLFFTRQTATKIKTVSLFRAIYRARQLLLHRLLSTYLTTFFSLPIIRLSGQRLTHEEVINQLDDETVSYEVGLGLADSFTETLRVSIRVETGKYETAIAWLRDLVYGSQFDQERWDLGVLASRALINSFAGCRSLSLKFSKLSQS